LPKWAAIINAAEINKERADLEPVLRRREYRQAEEPGGVRTMLESKKTRRW
jgi:hypothetical protein